MVISRTIGDSEVKIELTERELSTAYFEQEHLYDIEDVQNKIDEMSDDDFLEYGITRAQVESDIDTIAYAKRSNMNKYDMNWEYATQEAIDDYLSENAVEGDK